MPGVEVIATVRGGVVRGVQPGEGRFARSSTSLCWGLLIMMEENRRYFSSGMGWSWKSGRLRFGKLERVWWIRRQAVLFVGFVIMCC